MEKLSFLGIGPRIAWMILPYLAVCILLTHYYPHVFTCGAALRTPLLAAGFMLMFISLVLYASTVMTMLPALKQNRLATTGLYRWTRNPLYAVLLMLLIPSIALLGNSWLMLTVSIAGYAVFRKHIHTEEEQLERIFGEEYRLYRERTPLFFPFRPGR